MVEIRKKEMLGMIGYQQQLAVQPIRAPVTPCQEYSMQSQSGKAEFTVKLKQRQRKKIRRRRQDAVTDIEVQFDAQDGNILERGQPLETTRLSSVNDPISINSIFNSRDCSTDSQTSLFKFDICVELDDEPWKCPLYQRMAFLRKFDGRPAFGELSKELLVRACHVMMEVSYHPDDVIVEQGALVGSAYIIAKGSAEMWTNSTNTGEPRLLRCKKEGDCLCQDTLECDMVMSPYQISSGPDGVHLLKINGDLYRELVFLIKRQTDMVHASLCKSPSWNTASLAEGLERDQPISLSDFSHIGLLGEGAYGRVSLVRCHNQRYNNQVFALKRIRKKDITNQRQMNHVRMEKSIIRQLNSDFIVRCFSVLNDDQYIYHVMEACLGGDLWTVLKDADCLDEESTQFYIGCTIEALSYLHQRNIIYRDLKPENLLVDQIGYVKLADFGFAKRLDHCERTFSFCGTPSYIAPEVILNQGHDFAADYWSLGILTFELLSGRPPLSHRDATKVYSAIVSGFQPDGLVFPIGISQEAEDFISSLCRRYPSERLGYSADGWKDVREDDWFADFKWEQLQHRTMIPSYIPDVRSDDDMSNFKLCDSISSGSTENGSPSPTIFSPNDWKDF